LTGHTHLFLTSLCWPEAEQDRHFNGLFAPELLLAVAESPDQARFDGRTGRLEKIWRAVLRPFATLVIPVLTATRNCADAINAGRVPGPRILAAGRKLVARGAGYVRNLNPALAEAILQQEFLLLDGGPDRPGRRSARMCSRTLT